LEEETPPRFFFLCLDNFLRVAAIRDLRSANFAANATLYVAPPYFDKRAKFSFLAAPSDCTPFSTTSEPRARELKLTPGHSAQDSPKFKARLRGHMLPSRPWVSVRASTSRSSSAAISKNSGPTRKPLIFTNLGTCASPPSVTCHVPRSTNRSGSTTPHASDSACKFPVKERARACAKRSPASEPPR